MLFPTIRFAIFFAIVLPVSWLLMHQQRRWKAFAIAASFVFYGAWDTHYVFLLAGSIVGNQVLANLIHRASRERARDWWTAVAVVANVGVLCWYKYAGFLADSSSNVLGWIGVDWRLSVPNVLLPIGISFFTFQALSYVIDVRRRVITPVPLADFAVYLSFFPHLVAGPIVRAREFLPQLRAHDPRRVDTALAFWLIASGLIKKVVIASYLADVADSLFAAPQRHGGVEALLGVYGYALQIYADFSGYTDMAIGIALLLGFRFPANFDAPYSATSLQDFWRRWHITLSRWLRDYLYIPLGGGRGGRRRTYRNLMITMLLGGLWHGAGWTFVAWGALHGGGLAAERWSADRRRARAVAADGTPKHAITEGAVLNDRAEEDRPALPEPGYGTGASVAEAVQTSTLLVTDEPGHEVSGAPTESVTTALGAAPVPAPQHAAADDAPGGQRRASRRRGRGRGRRAKPAHARSEAPTLIPTDPLPPVPVELAAALHAAGPGPADAAAASDDDDPTHAVAQTAPEADGPVAIADPRLAAETHYTIVGAAPGSSRIWLRRIVTFHVVCLGWVFFRASSFANAFAVLGRLFQHGTVPIDGWVVAVVVGMLALQHVPARAMRRAQAEWSRWSMRWQVASLVAVLLLVDVLGPTGVAPFIYFQF
ncbi:MAG: MBOAT family protein [Acidimicrobiales bacterium]